MIDVRLPELRAHAFEGNFGLEREALRVTDEGRMSHTPHPFSADHPRVVRDFCENQTEINTRVWPSAEEAVAELESLNADILREIAAKNGELLWPFSNPPPLEGEDDVIPAKFTGHRAGKSAYRDYLSSKYGRYLMTYCGIHVNFSFGERLLAASGADRNALYLHVASESVVWGWIVVALTAASPLVDVSFLSRESGSRHIPSDVFTGFASVRCGDLGYWNHFAPVNDYSGVKAYADAIRGYVRRGLIAAPSELYYPVRLKPRGANRLETLEAEGIDHLELRCVDLNPFAGGLVDARDIRFVQLFLLWCAARPQARLAEFVQVQAVRNFKNAARYDLDLANITLPDGASASVRDTGLRLLDSMARFFADFPRGEAADIIAFERGKLERPESRYAAQVLERFGGTFAEKGLAHARKLTEDANV